MTIDSIALHAKCKKPVHEPEWSSGAKSLSSIRMFLPLSCLSLLLFFSCFGCSKPYWLQKKKKRSCTGIEMRKHRMELSCRPRIGILMFTVHFHFVVTNGCANGMSHSIPMHIIYIWWYVRKYLCRDIQCDTPFHFDASQRASRLLVSTAVCCCCCPCKRVKAFSTP